MKANGCSASRRFSARLKCTRPTRFQAGFRRVRKRCKPVPEAASAAAKASAISSHSAEQDRFGQIFRARHHRRGQHQGGEFTGIEGRHRGQGGVVLAPGALQAQRADVAGREGTPPDEHRRQGLPDLAGAQPHQPVAAALGKRLGQAGLRLGVDLRSILLLLGDRGGLEGSVAIRIGASRYVTRACLLSAVVAPASRSEDPDRPARSGCRCHCHSASPANISTGRPWPGSPFWT